MKSLLIAPIFLLGSLFAQESKEEKTAISPEESTRQSSLALGYQEGIRTAQKQMRVEDFNSEAYLEGFLLGIKGENLSLSPEEIREAMTRLQAKLTEREAQTAETNRQAAAKFLAANKNQKGVITTESGIQYRVVKAGEGETFGEEGLVEKEIYVNFRGTLPDGTQFAASNEFTPTRIELDDVIAGFREALGMMKKGDRWFVFIPSELAYGDQRRSSEIGPNQLLIFEIELVDVREAKSSTESSRR